MSEAQLLFADPQLELLYDKVVAQERLNREDGLTLYRSADLLGVGYLADLVRRRLHGRTAYYIYNQLGQALLNLAKNFLQGHFISPGVPAHRPAPYLGAPPHLTIRPFPPAACLIYPERPSGSSPLPGHPLQCLALAGF